ncbi:PTS transporter subunit EIIB [Spiroplasma chrysopicola]|uniref:Putative PTS system protein n=1 Tax=Spiroplasma chrysopicola DF-1 TaxID=1276227 RepID=R4U490_9MOLU|nr:PTS transporter subunit EIIB [Spiroplasma chrysopicola]AGM25378.1 putative PTS system protein [Spiroplasma chrysopicola DF-1]
MSVWKIILIVVGMIIMLLFIFMMVFWKKIFNYRKELLGNKTINFSVSDLITILGAAENIIDVRATMTRLKVTVKEIEEIDLALLQKKFKLKKIQIINQTLILPLGEISLKVEAAIKTELKR